VPLIGRTTTHDRPEVRPPAIGFPPPQALFPCNGDQTDDNRPCVSETGGPAACWQASEGLIRGIPLTSGRTRQVAGRANPSYRHDLLGLLEAETFWPYKRWAVRALAAHGRRVEAIQLAEASRGPWASDWDIDRLCEEILLSAGATDDAYARYGLTANRCGTYLATFRAVAKKYLHKSAGEMLSDLVTTTPGDEGKWFAAAKDAGLFREALALAERTPCDPRTLSRAARDYADDQPAFALGAGLLALYWLAQGYGYEITGADVWAAYSATRQVAERLGKDEQARADIRRIAATTQGATNCVARVLGRELGLS
jgi:hypothetical protein